MEAHTRGMRRWRHDRGRSPHRPCSARDVLPVGVVLMGPHDVAEESGDVLVCACGRPFAGPKRHDQHATHFHIERARAALRGEGDTDE